MNRFWLSVIIPAYNEEKRLLKTLAAVTDYLKKQSYDWEIAVFNDGSIDNTESVIKDFIKKSGVKILLLNHPDGLNHGKGLSLKRGFLSLSGQYRLFMDADNSTPINHVEKCFPLLEKNFDIVIGSRSLPNSLIKIRQPLWKEIMGKLGNIFIRLMIVSKIRDTQAGFKIFNANFVEAIFPQLQNEKWGFDFEVLALAQKYNYKIAEIPIIWTNDPESKVKLFDYLITLGEVVKIWWRHLRL